MKAVQPDLLLQQKWERKAFEFASQAISFIMVIGLLIECAYDPNVTDNDHRIKLYHIFYIKLMWLEHIKKFWI